MGVHSWTKLNEFFNCTSSLTFWALLNVLATLAITSLTVSISTLIFINTFWIYISSCNHCRSSLRWLRCWLVWASLFLDQLVPFDWTYWKDRNLTHLVGLLFELLLIHIHHKVVSFRDLLKPHRHLIFSWIFKDLHLYRDAPLKLFFWKLFWFDRFVLFFPHQAIHNIQWYWLIFRVAQMIILPLTCLQILESLRSLQNLQKTFWINCYYIKLAIQHLKHYFMNERNYSGKISDVP